MSQSSHRLERRSVEFNIRKITDIDPTISTMVTLNQGTINALVKALHQSADAVAPLSQRNAALAPAAIVEKLVEDLYKTGINTGTSNGKKLYQYATKELDTKDLITVNEKNARHFESEIKKQSNINHWQNITGNIHRDDAKDFELIQGYNSLTLQHFKKHVWNKYIGSHGDNATDPPGEMMMGANDPSVEDAQKERVYKRVQS